MEACACDRTPHMPKPVKPNQEESKLNNTINANSGAHALTDDKMISLSNRNNVATIKSKQN